MKMHTYEVETIQKLTGGKVVMQEQYQQALRDGLSGEDRSKALYGLVGAHAFFQVTSH
jgi:hypothetical protein